MATVNIVGVSLFCWVLYSNRPSLGFLKGVCQFPDSFHEQQCVRGVPFCVNSEGTLNFPTSHGRIYRITFFIFLQNNRIPNLHIFHISFYFYLPCNFLLVPFLVFLGRYSFSQSLQNERAQGTGFHASHRPWIHFHHKLIVLPSTIQILTVHLCQPSSSTNLYCISQCSRRRSTQHLSPYWYFTTMSEPVFPHALGHHHRLSLTLSPWSPFCCIHVSPTYHLFIPLSFHLSKHQPAFFPYQDLHHFTLHIQH